MNNNETHKRIAKIIGESVKGHEWKSWQGGYLHTTDGNVIATDGRRIVIVNGQENRHEPLFLDKDGDEVSPSQFPKYERFTNTNAYDVIGEWEINLGRIIEENGWMKVTHTKSLTDNRVLFKTKFIHHRKGNTSQIANEEEVNLNIFNIRFLTDSLRVYRAINKNRTKDMVVRMKFTRSCNQPSSPVYIETVDGKMSYVLMPISVNHTSRTNIADVIELENKNLF